MAEKCAVFDTKMDSEWQKLDTYPGGAMACSEAF